MGNERKIEKINRLAEKKKTDKVIKYASSKDPELRAAAASALSGICVDESYNELVLLIRDPELSVRKAAVVALGDMGRKAGADHVRHVMTHETDPEIIKLCQTAITKIINSDVR
ncbi:MAG: HEAT repeat domain-containing protein [Clostridiales bacterium]|jgi:HEAT repeat protein|nr:HEAT repeat domain-containing protein [Clostridiales bacterium]